MVERLLCELLGSGICHILAKPLSVKANFVHTNETDGREVVVEGAERALRIRIQTVVHQLGDDFPLDMQASGRDMSEDSRYATWGYDERKLVPYSKVH